MFSRRLPLFSLHGKPRNPSDLATSLHPSFFFLPKVAEIKPYNQYQYGIDQSDVAALESFSSPNHSDRMELINRIISIDNASNDELIRSKARTLMEEFRISRNDCGSAQVQIALLSLRINNLVEKATSFRKDFALKRHLTKSVHEREKHLAYLKRTDAIAYNTVVEKLGLLDMWAKIRQEDEKRRREEKAKKK